MTTSARMKPLFVCAILLSTLAIATAGQKYGVKATAEKNVDFSKFKTYTWTTGRPSPDKTIDGHIRAAVDRELAALGMTIATSGTGDVLVSYDSLRRTDVDVNAKPDAKGVRPQHPVGTLVVGLLDPHGSKRLLVLRADKPLDMTPGVEEREVNAAVAELFTQYPTRTQK
jgi:hypothetical protein